MGSDKDGDGVIDRHDQCPDAKEDRDNYQDDDGCPDLDNDGDNIPDKRDRCPNSREDLDNFQDNDGCPDPDNDQDQISDGQDGCPNQAEDRDNYEDSDGCPDPDNDQDKILDGVDRCPNEAEDMDGDRDSDGCPDDDRDGDGVKDNVDKCPTEPEDPDGFKDEDGCPESNIDDIDVLSFTRSIMLQVSYTHWFEANASGVQLGVASLGFGPVMIAGNFGIINSDGRRDSSVGVFAGPLDVGLNVFSYPTWSRTTWSLLNPTVGWGMGLLGVPDTQQSAFLGGPFIRNTFKLGPAAAFLAYRHYFSDVEESSQNTIELGFAYHGDEPDNEAGWFDGNHAELMTHAVGPVYIPEPGAAGFMYDLQLNVSKFIHLGAGFMLGGGDQTSILLYPHVNASLVLASNPLWDASDYSLRLEAGMTLGGMFAPEAYSPVGSSTELLEEDLGTSVLAAGPSIAVAFRGGPVAPFLRWRHNFVTGGEEDTVNLLSPVGKPVIPEHNMMQLGIIVGMQSD